MFIVGPDRYRISTVCYSLTEGVVELISEDDDAIRKFAFDNKNKDFITNVMQYQNIIYTQGCYNEHKKMLYLFCDIIMERLMEI